MAYSDYQADRIRERLRHHDHAEKKMMGGLVFMVRNAMCVGLDRDKSVDGDRLMVRVGPEARESLLGQRGSVDMDFTGRSMKGFLFVSADGFDRDEDLDFWIEKALEFNSTLT